MAVKFVWTTTIIIAISAGGAGFISTVALIVFLSIRFQKRRRPGRSQAARVRRLSRYPGGNLSLTNSEVEGLPSFRSFRQGRLSRAPYGVLGWSRTAESQETLSRRSCLSNASRTATTATVSRTDLHNGPGLISWPIQPPTAHTRGYTAGSVKALPLSPINERIYGNRADDPANKASSQNPSATGTIGGDSDNRASNTRHGTRLIAEDSHRAHRKSVSDGFLEIAKRGDPEAPKNDTGGFNEGQHTSQRLTRRRTLSLHSQGSGHVPLHRLESPPPELPRKFSRIQILGIQPATNGRRNSIASVESAYSSHYEDDFVYCSQNDDRDARPPSNETDLSTIAQAFGVPKGSPIVMGSGKLLTSKLPSGEAIDYAETSMSGNSQPQHRSNQFLRSNTRQRRVHRSQSSGLTPSLVDQHGPSRNVSNASHFDLMSKDTSRGTGPSSPQSPRATNSNEGDLPLQRPKNESTFGLGDAMSMRASASILQDISGNRCSLSVEDTARSTSVPTAQPFKWDTDGTIEPGKPSTLKGRSEGHKRQSCQRISFPSSSPGSKILAPMPEERSEGMEVLDARSGPPGLSVTVTEHSVSAPRPPSISTFEPQLGHLNVPHTRQQGDYSATLSVYNEYTMNSSSEELEGTPTRKPSAGRAQNRQSRFIYTRHESNTSWPLRGSSNFGTQPSSNTNNALVTNGNTLQIPALDATSFSPRFPDPQRKPPEWRLPTSHTIRGPRAAPPRRTHTGRSPRRQSPLRQAAKPSSNNKILPHLKDNVKELRRQNSEVWDSDAMLFKQFINLGDSSPLPATPELQDDGAVFEMQQLPVQFDTRYVGKGLGISVDEGRSPRTDYFGVQQKSQKSRART